MKKSLFVLLFVGLLTTVLVNSLVNGRYVLPGKPVTTGELGDVVAAYLPKDGKFTGVKQCTAIVKHAYVTCELNAAGTSCIGLDRPSTDAKTAPKDEQTCSGETVTNMHSTITESCGKVTFRFCNFYEGILGNRCGLTLFRKLTVTSSETYNYCEDMNVTPVEP